MAGLGRVPGTGPPGPCLCHTRLSRCCSPAMLGSPFRIATLKGGGAVQVDDKVHPPPSRFLSTTDAHNRDKLDQAVRPPLQPTCPPRRPRADIADRFAASLARLQVQVVRKFRVILHLPPRNLSLMPFEKSL
jgi:hypothetical protein